jgi:hypothetical protein
MVTCDEVEEDFDLSGSHRSDKSVPDPNLTELWAQCAAAEITQNSKLLLELKFNYLYGVVNFPISEIAACALLT